MKAKWFLRAFALLGVISLAACNDKEKKEEPVRPEFPELQKITLAPGESQEIKFTANMDWNLFVADRTWCNFTDGTTEFRQKSGDAGEGSVTIIVSDGNWAFDDPIAASITLRMGGEEKVIYEVTRPAKEREVRMYTRSFSGETPTNIETAVLVHKKDGVSVSMNIGFEANFEWKVLSKPSEYFTVEGITNGPANQDVSELTFGTIRLDDNLVAHAPEGYKEIVISDVNGNNPFSFRISYAGMGEHIVFSPLNVMRGVQYSKNGFLLDQGTGEETQNTEVSFAVLTQDMEYSKYIVDMDENFNITQVPEADSWLRINDSGDGTIKFSAEPNTSTARTTYLFVIPDTVENPDFEQYMNDLIERNNQYCITVTQKGESIGGIGGFTAMWGLEMVPLGSDDIFQMDAGQIAMIGNGAPEDNSYLYYFRKDRVKGALLVRANGWNTDMETGMIYSFVDISENGWREYVSHELTLIDSETMLFGVSVSFDVDGMSNHEIEGEGGELIPAPINDGLGVLLFYNSAEDQQNGKPIAAFVVNYES